MADPYVVATLIGSLRAGSLTRKVVHAMIEIAPSSLRLEEVPIGGLSHYNQDDEADPPAAWRTFRDAVHRTDAVLFATPEYNRSVPGVLKNAIDIGSRPRATNAWDGKPGAVVSVTNGALGAFGANHHLRQSLVFVNVPTMQQPEAYIAHAASLFDESGRLVNDGTREFLRHFLDAFAAWIARLTPPRAPV